VNNARPWPMQTAKRLKKVVRSLLRRSRVEL
jgi:hypothetical protein